MASALKDRIQADLTTAIRAQDTTTVATLRLVLTAITKAETAGEAHAELAEKPEDPGKSLKTKFGIFGEEVIEKEVKRSGNTGRVYLPQDWVGKHVKIVRVD
jgi:hypothetical protein